MARLAVTLVLAVVACGGGTDADDVQIDARPATGTCTNAVFDLCSDNAECDSMNCHLFTQSAFQVCVQPCTPGDNSTCPVDVTGTNAVCNNMGLCKPAEPNACTRN